MRVANIAVGVDIWVPDLREALSLHPEGERTRCVHVARTLGDSFSHSTGVPSS